MTEFSADQKEIAKKVWGKEAIKSIKKDNENVIYTSYLETDRYILEQVVNATHATHATHGMETQFIKINKDTGTIEELEEFRDESLGEMTYKPIVDDLMKTKTILLPSGVEEYGSTGKLVGEVRDFLSGYFELPSFYEKFVPYLALFYWTYDRFPFVPYLHFVGRTGTGKSTAMEVFGSICYKAIDASGAITMASIFRTASRWRGTLLLDEFSASGDNYQEMIAFLKSGVSNKAVLRVEGDREKEVKAYMIKSPKLFTSEDPITDAGLQSRTIVIKMDKNKRRIPLYRLKRYEDDALRLRNKLLLWRLRNIDKVDLSAVEYGFEELMGFDRRVQQVITPIFYFSNEETKADILNFAKEQQEETLRERRESLNGQIFQLIAEQYPHEVSIKLITDEINKERSGKHEYSEKKIANVVRKILGFDIQRMGHDKQSFVTGVTDEAAKELCLYYGVSLPERVASVASVAGASNGHYSAAHKNDQIEMPLDVPQEEDVYYEGLDTDN